MLDIPLAISQVCQKRVTGLIRRYEHEVHIVCEDGEDLVRLCAWAREAGCYLCTAVATDERNLEDQAFKLHYVLSTPDDRLIILEYRLPDPLNPRYPSVRHIFPGVEPLEKEFRDLIGIIPWDGGAPGGTVLYPPYPPDLYPLRPRQTQSALRERISASVSSGQPRAASRDIGVPMPEGVTVFPVGPIHAGIIEAGQYLFYVAGEVIEDVELRLSYKHRGVEKLFESNYVLENGVELAERITGDASFAHAMAYCEAVEALVTPSVDVPQEAHLWRALLLELERLHNHVGDVAAVTHDISFDLKASDLAALREELMRLNARITGHRLLRGVNLPGGVVLKQVLQLGLIRSKVDEVTDRFLELGQYVLKNAGCRDRLITTGILTRNEATSLGATGLVARAAGLIEQDFRLRHPRGAYRRHPEWQTDIRAAIATGENEPGRAYAYALDLRGDAFARVALRIAEVESSARLIGHILDELEHCNSGTSWVARGFDWALRAAADFDFGLGYVESWRGDVVYWVMKGPANTIFRCKVRDPSLFNWPALRCAVKRKPIEEDQAVQRFHENILADFPIINKSFNLSYAGYAL